MITRNHRCVAAGARPFASYFDSGSQRVREFTLRAAPGAAAILSHVLLLCMLLLGFAMLLPGKLFAQGATGRISGHVADSTGAVIPDVHITLTNTATSGVSTTVSTNSGDYTFSAVPVGSYILKAEHTGFKTATSQNLDLQVAQSMTQNFTLEVGGYDALLGESYPEIAARSRSMHKSQGFGATPNRGNATEYFKLLAGEPMQKSLFDGIDRTWGRVPQGDPVARRAGAKQAPPHDVTRRAVCEGVVSLG